MSLSLQTGNAAALEVIPDFVSSSHAGSTLLRPSETTGQEIVDATKLCADLAHQTALLEKRLNAGQADAFGTLLALRPTRDSHLGSELATVQTILRQSIPLLVSAVQKTEAEAKNTGINVAQAIENFRRTVIRTKNADGDSITAITLAQLLHDVTACFNSAFEQVWAILCPLSVFRLKFTVRG